MVRHATDYAVYFTLKSSNGKIGPIPVSTVSNETCPDVCPLKTGGGCYANGGPLAIIWKALSNHTPGAVWRNGVGARMQSLTWNAYCYAVSQLPNGQEWRHGQAGDLPGVGDDIDARALRKLVAANKGKRGWAYTHKPVLASDTVTAKQAAANAAAIAHANAEGFTVNLSANSISEVDALVALGIAPVAVVLPADVHGKQDIFTPNGTRVVVCPATYQEETRCVDCMLCEKRERKCAVGFPAHGASKRKASNVASRVVITRNAA
jgi:hypothetical protein